MKILPTLFLLNLLLCFDLFSQNEGDLFFRDTVHEIRFYFSQPGYWDSLVANKPDEIYLRCDVTVDGAAYPDSGVRFKGNSSYNNPSIKKPFKIDFEEFVDDQTHDGMKQISLSNGFKDPTFMREKLMLDFCRQHDIPAPRATYALLFINGEYWGLYTAVEDVGKTFLKQRFGNKSGNLFKGDPNGKLIWKGWDQIAYENDYELKTNKSENDWSDLITFLNALNNTPVEFLPDSLPVYVNLSSWFKYWAVHNLFANLDSYIGSGHNYYIYHNDDTGQFEFITWDVNEAFGNFKMGLSEQQLLTLPFTHIPQPANQRPLMLRLLPNEDFKQQLADALCNLLQDFSNEQMDAAIDQLANLIRPHVYGDTKKFYSNEAFENNINLEITTPGGPSGPFVIAGLKPFIAGRRTALINQLSSFGCLANSSAEPHLEEEIRLYPNPSTGYFRLSLPNNAISKVWLYAIDGSLRNIWQASEKDGLFGCGEIPTGLYLVKIETTIGEVILKRLVVIAN